MNLCLGQLFVIESYLLSQLHILRLQLGVSSQQPHHVLQLYTHVLFLSLGYLGGTLLPRDSLQLFLPLVLLLFTGYL